MPGVSELWGSVHLLMVVDAIPVVVVLVAGLVALLRRRAVLGRAGTVAIAGVVAMLVAHVGYLALSIAVRRALLTGSFDPVRWAEEAHWVLLPIDLAALPLLAWAIFARRSTGSVEVPA